MGRTVVTPGFYGLRELTKDDMGTLAYPVQVAKVASPHLVLLYAENKQLKMGELKIGSINFDHIKQFCMVSPQEERLLCDYCQKENASVLCEVRAPEYNLTCGQESSIVTLAVIPYDPEREVDRADTLSLETRYWKAAPTGRNGNVRVVTEPISLGLAVELAVWDARSPGIVIVDSEGAMYRVTSHEWEVRNKLLQDLYECLLEGRIRRLTYPRVDEHEEYYREKMEERLKNESGLWDDITAGNKPLWEAFDAVDKVYVTYKVRIMADAVGATV